MLIWRAASDRGDGAATAFTCRAARDARAELADARYVPRRARARNRYGSSVGRWGTSWTRIHPSGSCLPCNFEKESASRQPSRFYRQDRFCRGDCVACGGRERGGRRPSRGCGCAIRATVLSGLPRRRPLTPGARRSDRPWTRWGGCGHRSCRDLAVASVRGSKRYWSAVRRRSLTVTWTGTPARIPVSAPRERRRSATWLSGTTISAVK